MYTILRNTDIEDVLKAKLHLSCYVTNHKVIITVISVSTVSIYLCPLNLKNDVMWDDFKFEIYSHEKKKVGFGIGHWVKT